MKAVIIAGGKGTRLRPLTYDIPKALVPVGGKPILEHQIEELKRYGIEDILICTGYKHRLIEKAFGNGSRFGVMIRYVNEKRLLGTGGAIKNARRFVESAFLVLYGDIFFNMDLRRLISFHERKRAIATLVLHESSHPYDSDLIRIDRSSRVVELIGKPEKGKPLPSKMSNASIYVLEPKVFGFMPKGRHSFEKDVIPNLITTGKVYGFVTREYVKDMGTLDRLSEVNKIAAEHGKHFQAINRQRNTHT